MTSILANLDKMAIFKMSLGSKELFHSNFLEYLFDIDDINHHSNFISAINSLLPGNKKLSDTVDYKISREKENFDICLYHEEKRKKVRNNQKNDTYVVYDLILENKVKSIPYKEQLKEYEKKVADNKWNKGNPPSYLLVSLVCNFPDREEIEKENVWTITDYSRLKAAIDNNFQLNDTNNGKYIQDYCKFIDLMHNLQEKILENFENQPIFKDVDDFRKYRLHDLYIKLRCANFLILLKKKLDDKKVGPVQFTNSHARIRENGKRGIYLNQNMFNSVGQIAAFLYRNDGYHNDVYEIVIQGDQYRHGINSIRLEDKSKGKIGSQNILWNNFKTMPFESEFLSLSKIDKIEGDSKPIKARNNKKSDVPKEGPFCGYDYGYIYRHKDIGEKNAGDLLDIMVNDIEQTF